MAIYDYQTEELVNFTLPENQRLYQEALSKVRGYL